jgi:molecular chaperone Hsp33
VISTGIVRDSVARHGLDPIAAIALGRALSCVAALASTLKHEQEYVHITISGGGPIGKLLVECNGAGHCRGYSEVKRLSEVITIPKFLPQSVGEAVGESGSMTITRGRIGEAEPYRTISELANGEVSTDLARYLADSEQIPSAIASGVKIGSDGAVLGAGAALVQQLGGQKLEENELRSLEKRMSEVMISDRIAAGESVQSIINFIADSDKSLSVLNSKPLKFQCTCSRERMANALFALGKVELQSILQDVGKIESRCPYCSSTHKFTLEELVPH